MKCSSLYRFITHVKELPTDEESVDHVQHMGYEKNDVELIESDDDDVDLEPFKRVILWNVGSLRQALEFSSPKMLVLGTNICFKSND